MMKIIRTDRHGRETVYEAETKIIVSHAKLHNGAIVGAFANKQDIKEFFSLDGSTVRIIDEKDS